MAMQLGPAWNGTRPQGGSPRACGSGRHPERSCAFKDGRVLPVEGERRKPGWRGKRGGALVGQHPLDFTRAATGQE